MGKKVIFTFVLITLLILYPTIVSASDNFETRWRISINVESDYAPAISGDYHAWQADFLNYAKEFSPQLSVDPVIQNGRVLVPLRQISEALGYTVQWQPQNQEIKLQGKNLLGEELAIRMNINQNNVTLNQQTMVLDTPPRIVNGNTLIPLRFVSEAMGCFVKYKPWQSGTPGDQVNWVDIYITDYPLLESNEIPDGDKNDSNYYVIENVWPHLRQGGQTSRGVKLGDSISQVLKVYPRGVKKFPDNFTGTLMYDEWIAYQCGSWVMLFEFENGILKDVYAAN